MLAMRLNRTAPVENAPLSAQELAVPGVGPGELLLRVTACGVCHTDLHTVEGDIALPRLPIVPGHQIVGVVEEIGEGVSGWSAGERAGAAWLRRACGRCRFCLAGSENLCGRAEFNGLHADGGYAEYATVPADFAYRVPDRYADHEAAPLLCGGIIGYRALRRCRVRPGERLGLYGFGASAHVAIQVALHWGCEVYVFTRSENHRALARKLGAAWVGGAEETPPEKLDAAIIFAPAGYLVRESLRVLQRGGTLALAGITMTPIPELDYDRLLYQERAVTSVANATRQDGRELLDLAGEIGIRTRTEVFPLNAANLVLRLLKESRIEASAVLDCSGSA